MTSDDENNGGSKSPLTPSIPHTHGEVRKPLNEKFEIKLTNAALIKEWPESLIPYTSYFVNNNENDRILICFAEKAAILDLKTWEVLRTINANTPAKLMETEQEK